MSKFFLKSMGCKSNQYEGSIIEESLINAGFEKVNNLDEADYFILNSCTVTHKADNETFYILRNAKHVNSNIKTVLTGCVAQVEKKQLLEKDYIDFVIGNDEKLKLAEYLLSDTKFAVQNIMEQVKFNDTLLLDTSKTRACVKIQDGCDNRCSYCIIPFARGKSRSASEDFIIKQINTLSKHNFKEIVLTGIHIGQWGKDINKSFLDLLKFLEENSPIERIRMGSLNPLEITEDVLEFLSKSKKFCPHFHLSLQSANNNTLRRMNRFYTVEKYLEQIENINAKFNLPFLGSDIIAGFVGETDEEFSNTVENLKKLGLTQIHTFPYSRRKGTVADKMDGHIDGITKKKRVHEVLKLSNELENKFYTSKVGQIYDGVVEVHDNGLVVVHTSNFIPVIINDKVDNNSIVNVQIEKVEGLNVYGKIVK